MTRITRSSTKYSQESCNKSNENSGRTRKKTPVSKPMKTLSDSENCSSLVEPKISTPRKDKSRVVDGELECISPATPPKVKKLEATLFQTPQQKKNGVNDCYSPSTLFNKLKLSSPQHKTNRKSLFKEERSGNNFDANEENNFKQGKDGNSKADNLKLLDLDDPDIDIEEKLGINLLNDNLSIDVVQKTNSIYQDARRALHSTLPTDLPGREKELEELKTFIKQHLTHKTSGSLYISGPPGTGKTAALSIILQETDVVEQLKEVYVNCTAIKSPTAIYSRIVKELDIKTHGKTEKDYLCAIENYLKKNKKMMLLVLDEIDQLECKNQSILYTIFEWPSKPNYQLILIGIANALDLTDRTLPRLQSRCELKPKLMSFAPYTKQQIIQIFTSRLKAAGVLKVFSPLALQTLAGKVAATSGDVRRALDIGRRVIEVMDQSKKEDTLKSIENVASAMVDRETKTVEYNEVRRILNNVYGTSQTLTEEAEDSFPLQQKIIICSLVLMLKKAKNKDITIGKLHEVYRRACIKRKIHAVDQSEFVGLCKLIETRGIIRVFGKKESRLHKVSLEWDEEEVAAALKDKQLISTILQDDDCLGKF